ncbi:uncharacterized protein P884DRAFT_300835 [Thermothelomyces heterothallicus CBS 202.75]|uniref:uncharacterized protein n=1 Tax=Thermothelomyces heterothallicus CBS 202.75 TaxID=1149848 RepID=UPI003743AC20
MRRYAANPGLSVSPPKDVRRPTHFLSRTSSVDLIAEQYRAVLESRHASVHSGGEEEKEEEGWEPALSSGGDNDDSTGSRCFLSHEVTFEDPSRMVAEFPDPSPASEDGTLVSFRGDTVYFKPVSFSPVPSPVPAPAPNSNYDPEPEAEAEIELKPELEPEWPHAAAADPHPRSREKSPENNVSLQICLDLLTRELSSAMPAAGHCPGGRSSAPDAGMSALQVWVMIEAYERLRDHMAELSSSNEQARSMERMFDMWLRALYSIHDAMAEKAKAQAGRR